MALTRREEPLVRRCAEANLRARVVVYRVDAGARGPGSASVRVWRVRQEAGQPVGQHLIPLCSTVGRLRGLTS